MKKFFIFTLAVALGMPLFSQQTAIATAYDYLESYKREKENGNDQSAIENLLAAKQEIDGVTRDPSTSGLSRAWKRKGEVYFYIATDQSPRLTLYREGAIDTAIVHLHGACTVEKRNNGKPKIEGKQDIIYFLSVLGDTCIKMGNLAYDNNDINSYFNYMQQAIKAYEALVIADNNENAKNAIDILNQNMAATAANSGDADLINKYVMPMIDAGTAPSWAYSTVCRMYMDAKELDKAKDVITKGKEQFPDDADIAIAELTLAFEMGETDKAGELIEAAKKNFPDRKAEFILQEVNFHLTKGNNEAAIGALDEAIGAYKDNPDVLKLLYFNTGVIYSQMANKAEEAEDMTKRDEYRDKTLEYYQKTVEVAPDYAAAYNGIANYYVMRGNDYLDIANGLPIDEQKKYDEMMDKANEEFMLAIPNLEKAYELDKQPSYKRVLIVLYERTKQYDKKKALENEQ